MVPCFPLCPPPQHPAGLSSPVCLFLEAPKDLSTVFCHHHWRGVPPCYRCSCKLGQPLGCDITCQHITTCSLLDCLRGFFAQPAPQILPGVVDPGFYCLEGIMLLLLRLQNYGTNSTSARPSPYLIYLILNTFLIPISFILFAILFQSNTFYYYFLMSFLYCLKYFELFVF